MRISFNMKTYNLVIVLNYANHFSYKETIAPLGKRQDRNIY